MLLYRVFFVSLAVLTSLGTSVPGNGTVTSLCPDVSGCHCTRFAAHCTGNTTVYAHAVQALPSDLKKFVFTMLNPNKDMTLDLEIGGGLRRFWNLRVLQIQPYGGYKHGYGISKATASVLCYLTNLEEIHLNAFMSTLKEDGVQCMQALNVLDLSYTFGLNTDDLKAVLAAPLSRHITTLLLRKVQRFNDPNANMQVLDFGKLFKGLNRDNLRVLDLAENALTSLKPGLLLMPRLEKLDLSNNLIGVEHGITAISDLTFAEAFFHPRLMELICMNQGFYPRRGSSANWTPEMYKTKVHQNDGKQNDRAELSTEKAWKTLPLALLGFASMPSMRQASVSLGTKCMFNIWNIPIGRYLSVINFKGFSRETTPFRNPVPRGTTLCVNPVNNVQKIDVSDLQLALFVEDPAFTNVSVSGLRKLEVFNARNNGLTVHYKKLILNSEVPSLRTLLLGGNRISVGSYYPEPNESKKQLPAVQHLDLSQNGLSTIQRDEFFFLSKLLILDLSGNHLTEFDLRLPDSVELLNISNNKLTILREDVTKYLDTFHNLTVDVTYNYFVCSCKTYDFIRWLQHTKTKLSRQHNLYCYTETGQMLIMQINLHTLYKECNPLTPVELAAIGAAASIALCLVLLLVFITYRKRWRIRYYFYRRRLLREWDEGYDDYEYDAFVAYSDETPEVRRWVNVTMQTELEQKRGLKIFLHQRDLLGGGFLLERIDDAMRRCRKTILVLSPDFLKSRVCLYQAWSAHTSMVTEQRDAVVLVRLQALPIGGITGTLTTLMEIRECFVWTENQDGQELFWDRLQDALLASPDNPLHS